MGLGAAREFVSFVSLGTDDEAAGQRQEVQLMSLHAAKGKEFPVGGWGPGLGAWAGGLGAGPGSVARASARAVLDCSTPGSSSHLPAGTPP